MNKYRKYKLFLPSCSSSARQLFNLPGNRAAKMWTDSPDDSTDFSSFNSVLNVVSVQNFNCLNFN